VGFYRLKKIKMRNNEVEYDMNVYSRLGSKLRQFVHQINNGRHQSKYDKGGKSGVIGNLTQHGCNI
jgi:hypothetical protein